MIALWRQTSSAPPRPRAAVHALAAAERAAAAARCDEEFAEQQEEVAARQKQRWRESGDECKMLATRGLASVAQLREALGEGGERVEASVDAVERVLREVQGAWKKEDE